MRKVIKRQRTIVGRLQREVARKMTTLSQAIQQTLSQTLDKAKRLARKGLCLLLRLLQASGLTGLFEKLAEIFALKRVQDSDNRWVLA